MEDADLQRCALCPHPADTRVICPYEGDLETAPWVALRCLHRFHTHCYMVYNCSREDDGLLRQSCPTCRQTVLDPASIQTLTAVRTNAGYEGNERMRMHDLWNNDEAFRENVKELHKLQRKANGAGARHRKEVAVLLREWRQMITPTVAYLKTQKQTFTMRMMECENRREAMLASGKYQKKRREMMQTYDTGYWGLGLLSDIPGAPKLQSYGRHYRRSARYVFRVRV